MTDQDKHLLIPKIKLGIVIDHIPAGKGALILGIIEQYEEMKDVLVTLGKNYDSKKLGKKDLIKLQLEFLDPEIIQHISIVVPGVTVKAVKDFKVHSKVVVQPPKEISNLLQCRNPNCVTNTESHIKTFFTVVNEKERQVKCEYCERIFELRKLKSIFN
jgi:aspartate carbamoyltransferase regulatory subunit